MEKKKLRPAVVVGLLVLLTLLAFMTAYLARHDLALSNWAQHLPRAHDNFTIWWLVENYGEWPTWIVLGIGIMAYFLSFEIERWRRFRPALQFLFLTEMIGPGLLNLGLKYAINRPRPGNSLGFFPLFSVGPDRTDNGFPSGHTASAFVLLALAYLIPRSKPILRRLVGACFFSWGVVVAVSRVVWGAHYPTDVFFGALITVIVEYVLWAGWFKKRVEGGLSGPPGG
jgi:membrane-associated phospholipid phosphatase